MKKTLLFLLVAVIAAGVVWGKDVDLPPVSEFDTGMLGSPVNSLGLWDFFVVPTVSTESRYSAGIFSSYADDYLWFSGFDPQVGTFLLLGGYDTSGSDVADTDYVTNGLDELSFGFGKSFKSGGYLGAYFGGKIVEAEGSYNGLTGKDSHTTASSTWANNFAIFFGSKSFGGIRFDISYEDTNYDKSDGPDGESDTHSVTNAPKIAISYGNTFASGLEFYVQLGYKFADLDTATDPEKSSNKDTNWGSSKFALQLGINKPTVSGNTESAFSLDFLIGGESGSRAEGNYQNEDHHVVNGGTFILGADVGFKQVIKADDKVSFGFKPNLAFALSFDDTSSLLPGSEDTANAAKTVLFELAAGVNIGLKFQINPKFALYSGIGFNLFSFKSGGYIEGLDQKYDKDDDPYVKSSAWNITGISPRDETLHNGSNLGFGLTFAPSKNIVIGAGLNTLLDRIVAFDVSKMQLVTDFSNNSASSELGWISDNFLSGLEFDLTISLKF